MSRVTVVNMIGENVTVDTDKLSIDSLQSLIVSLNAKLEEKHIERDRKNDNAEDFDLETFIG